jgi:F0F1-type ATP synthase assembly protein I
MTMDQNPIEIIVVNKGDEDASQPQPDNPPPPPSPPPNDNEEAAPSPRLVECRICLMADPEEKMVTPCHCSGTVAWCHIHCLKTWSVEKCSLTCEICSQPYNKDIEVQLKPGVEAAQKQRREEAAALVVVANRSNRERQEEEEEERRRQQQPTWLYWVKVFGIICILAGLVYFLLWLGSLAGDNVWAAITLRIIGFIVPVFLIYKATQACVQLRRRSREMDAAAEAGRGGGRGGDGRGGASVIL